MSAFEQKGRLLMRVRTAPTAEYESFVYKRKKYTECMFIYVMKCFFCIYWGAWVLVLFVITYETSKKKLEISGQQYNRCKNLWSFLHKYIEVCFPFRFFFWTLITIISLLYNRIASTRVCLFYGHSIWMPYVFVAIDVLVFRL